MLRFGILMLLAPVALGGCIALSDTTPSRQTTVVVPSGIAPTVICSNGTAPPCY